VAQAAFRSRQRGHRQAPSPEGGPAAAGPRGPRGAFVPITGTAVSSGALGGGAAGTVGVGAGPIGVPGGWPMSGAKAIGEGAGGIGVGSQYPEVAEGAPDGLATGAIAMSVAEPSGGDTEFGAGVASGAAGPGAAGAGAGSAGAALGIATASGGAGGGISFRRPEPGTGERVAGRAGAA
jgi:hypothetical protein